MEGRDRCGEGRCVWRGGIDVVRGGVCGGRGSCLRGRGIWHTKKNRQTAHEVNVGKLRSCKASNLRINSMQFDWLCEI